MALSIVAPTEAIRPGLAFVGRYVLQAAIVVLGATIDLQAVASVGVGSLPVMLSSLSAALGAAFLFGRLLGVPARLRTLLGVGTGICGASAIATVSGVVGARERELGYAVSTIFIFNLLAVLTFIPLAHLMGLTQHQFGLWDGTAVNDVSSVVAAGFAYGHGAGAYAVIVKLTRTTMIIPITLVLARLRRRHGARGAGGAPDSSVGAGVESGLDSRSGSAAGHRAGRLRTRRPGTGSTRTGRLRIGRVIPWFLVFFLLASAADTLGLWGSGTRTELSHTGLILTTVALAAIGLSTDFGEARRTGHRPLLLGALVWISVSIVSLAVGHLTGGI